MTLSLISYPTLPAHLITAGKITATPDQVVEGKAKQTGQPPALIAQQVKDKYTESNNSHHTSGTHTGQQGPPDLQPSAAGKTGTGGTPYTGVGSTELNIAAGQGGGVSQAGVRSTSDSL
jgi:hypothetical protein